MISSSIYSIRLNFIGAQYNLIWSGTE